MGRISAVGVASVVAAACLVGGCASMQTKEWTGHRIDEVIKELGAPTRTVPTADGQTMYMWVLEHSIPQSSWGPGGTVSTTSTKQITTWSFLVDKAGIVVSWNKDVGAMS